MVLDEGVSKTTMDNRKSVHVVCMQYRQLFPAAAHHEKHTAIHPPPLPCHSRTNGVEDGWHQRQQTANGEAGRATTGNVGGYRCGAG